MTGTVYRREFVDVVRKKSVNVKAHSPFGPRDPSHKSGVFRHDGHGYPFFTDGRPNFIGLGCARSPWTCSCSDLVATRVTIQIRCFGGVILDQSLLHEAAGGLRFRFCPYELRSRNHSSSYSHPLFWSPFGQLIMFPRNCG